VEYLVKLLPMWTWVERVVDSIPAGYKNANTIPEDKRIGGFKISGLVLNFCPVSFHHDVNDFCPAILSYFKGPWKDPFIGGQFIIKCMGISFPVDPMDCIIFESRLFHEVGNVIGTRFNITSMFKSVGKINKKPILKGEEWLFQDNFGIDFNQT